jgi:hypothetical protein
MGSPCLTLLNLDGLLETLSLPIERLGMRRTLAAERRQDFAVGMRLDQIVHLPRIGFQVEKHFEIGLPVREIDVRFVVARLALTRIRQVLFIFFWSPQVIFQAASPAEYTRSSRSGLAETPTSLFCRHWQHLASKLLPAGRAAIP